MGNDFSLDSYDYHLPEELIAQTPAQNRMESRLLMLCRATGQREHHEFSYIRNLLGKNDVLVVNDTRVVKARLLGKKETGGRVEALVMDFRQGMQNEQAGNGFCCPCLVRASKAPRPGTRLVFDKGYGAEVLEKQNNFYLLNFFCQNGQSMLEDIGKVPLPPYIHREAEGNAFDDAQNYQTVYADRAGAVAAPTAGLHFTEELLAALVRLGVETVKTTLHVGYGTFEPLREPDVRDHVIHEEWCSLSKNAAQTLNKARQQGKRIVAVGTTSVRTLEHAFADGVFSPFEGMCGLYIYPGYRFGAVDAMITNFHLPKSSLLLLVSAFARRDMVLSAYKEAIDLRYRFFSYGDAMFIH